MSTQPSPVDTLDRGRGKPGNLGAVVRVSRHSYTPLLAGTGLIAAALLVYSQTYAFAWDEGFHLLAAQLIAHGKRPYLDFLFAQTPLNAYWNAALMRLFGESWRIA